MGNGGWQPHDHFRFVWVHPMLGDVVPVPVDPAELHRSLRTRRFLLRQYGNSLRASRLSSDLEIGRASFDHFLSFSDDYFLDQSLFPYQAGIVDKRFEKHARVKGSYTPLP